MSIFLPKLFDAAAKADWMQVVLNQGPPCFYLAENGRFCLRAQRWGGHGESDFHKFVSFKDLLRTVVEEAGPHGIRPSGGSSAEHQLLRAASHALRSYQFSNAAKDLAKDTADRIDDYLSRA